MTKLTKKKKSFAIILPWGEIDAFQGYGIPDKLDQLTPGKHECLGFKEMIAFSI
jgi:hypothetical protein